MKKITKIKAMLIALMIFMGLIAPLTATAQRSDGFFKNSGNYENRTEGINDNTGGGIHNDDFGAPLGSGLLILTAAGVGYAICRRKNSYKSCKTCKIHESYTNGVTLFLAFAMLLGMTNCKKKVAEPIAQPTGDDKVTIILNIDGGSKDDDIKAVVTPPSVAFENGDEILVASNGHYVGTLTHNGTNFSGDITAPVVGEPLYFYFLGNKQGTLTVGDEGCTVDISDQSNYPHLPVISMGVSIDRSNHNAIVNYSSGVHSYEAQLHNKASLIKFNVTTHSNSPICITGMNNRVTVKFNDRSENDGFSYGKVSNEGVIKMKGESGTNVEKWAIVLQQNALEQGTEGSAYTEDGTYIGARAAVPEITMNQFIDANRPMTVNTVTPLTFEAKTASTVISFNANAGATLEYSLNGGAWTAYSSPITLTEIGDKVYFRGDNTAMASSPSAGNCSKFSCTGSAYVYGNVMSLLNKTEYASATSVPAYAFCRLLSDCTNIYNHETKALVLPATTLGDYCYAYMFNACSNLTSAPVLPATTLAADCYANMFNGCTGLTTAPTLPATSLAYACYWFMFSGCTSLASAPVLPATTLSGGCYMNMFMGCIGLTSAPALPATTLADMCYYQMFMGCTNLTIAPNLPATTLSAGSYAQMFMNCTSLNSVTCLATDMSASDCTTEWLKNVAATGRFYKATSANWTNGDSGVPNGWSVVHTTFDGFNSETTAHPILEISSDLGGTSIITRNDGVVDLQGHTIFILYCQNNTLGTTLTIQNGRLSGGLDGNGGWNDNYYGTVRLVNMNINDVFNDGHAFVIESGTYTNVRNTAKDGASPAYPGTYTIYGGYFNAFGSDLASGHHYGTYTLYGGYYKFNPTSNTHVTIASGYKVETCSGDYGWRVVQE